MSEISETKAHRSTVIIAGGGIAGLTLANALQQAHIDYILLDRRDTVTPDVGASIAFFPNGARILDQLGCFEGLMKTTVPLTNLEEYDHRGKLFSTKQSDLYLWITKRAGYDVPFIDRHHVLESLRENI